MANTNTITVKSYSPDRVIVELYCVSDGSEETDLVVYDSSAVATLLGKADSLNCTLMSARITSCVNATTTGAVALEFDATTDVTFGNLPFSPITTSPATTNVLDFAPYGGLSNLSGTGRTGDITVTTASLDSGDAFLLYLVVRPY